MSNGPVYTLGERLYSADGIVTYRGFVTSTNEAVYIHALPVGSIELYDRALKLFRSYSVERPILNLFAFDGQPYVITRPGPEQTNFRSWLSAQTALQDRKSSTPPVILHEGREHSTPRRSASSGNGTVSASPSLGLAPVPTSDLGLETPGPRMSDTTYVFGTNTVDQPRPTPSQVPASTDVPPDDLTRLIQNKNLTDRKNISEPHGLEVKREEPPASEPAYGAATRVFQSPRKSAGPASHGPPVGEPTRINGQKDTAHQFAEAAPGIKGEGGEQETKAEQPTIYTESRSLGNKQRTSRLPLVLVLILSVLIVIAVIAYLALWAK